MCACECYRARQMGRRKWQVTADQPWCSVATRCQWDRVQVSCILSTSSVQAPTVLNRRSSLVERHRRARCFTFPAGLADCRVDDYRKSRQHLKPIILYERNRDMLCLSHLNFEPKWPRVKSLSDCFNSWRLDQGRIRGFDAKGSRHSKP